MNTALKIFHTEARLAEVFNSDVAKFSGIIGANVDISAKCINTGTELVYYMLVSEESRISGLKLDRVVYEEVMDVAEDFELLLMERMNI